MTLAIETSNVPSDTNNDICMQAATYQSQDSGMTSFFDNMCSIKSSCTTSPTNSPHDQWSILSISPSPTQDTTGSYASAAGRRKGTPTRSLKREHDQLVPGILFKVLATHTALIKSLAEYGTPFLKRSSVNKKISTAGRVTRLKKKLDEELNVEALIEDEEDEDEEGGIDSPVPRKKDSNCSYIKTNLELMTVSRRISAHRSVEGKQCIACNATRTPYWRDAWNEQVMLCNACGLRYQKFKIHCGKCNYVPRKEDYRSPDCPQCKSEWI